MERHREPENMMNMAVAMGLTYLHFSIQNFPLNREIPVEYRALGRKIKSPADSALTSAHWDLES